MSDLMANQMQAALLQAGQTPNTQRMQQVQTPQQAREVAEEFEAVFLAQLLEHMMGDSTESEAFGGGAGESAWKGMLNEEYAKVMAKAGGIGLADDLAREMMALQDIGETS